MILVLIMVGGTGYMIGQNSSKGSPVSLPDNNQGEAGVLEDANVLAENPDYFEAVDDWLLMWPIVDVNAYLEPLETSEVVRVNPKGVSLRVLEKGHGKYDGWYHVNGIVKAEKYDGYVESKYLSLEEVEVDVIQVAEQKPVEQKPAVPQPIQQKPTVQQPDKQEPEESGGGIALEDFLDSIETGENIEEGVPEGGYIIPGAVTGEEFAAEMERSEEGNSTEENSSDSPEDEAEKEEHEEKPKNNHPGYYIYTIGNTMHGVYRNVVDAMKSGETEVVERENYYEIYGKNWTYKMDKEIYQLVMESINE